MSELKIPEDLKVTCPLCAGAGEKEVSSFYDPSIMLIKICHVCKRKGWIWALDLDEMAERIARAEARATAAEAENKRLLSNPIEYAFNLSGQRASSWNGTLGGWMEGQSYWGSMPVEFYSSGVAHFQHQDWTGTERVRTTYNGAIEATFQSLPFGDGLTTGSA